MLSVCVYIYIYALLIECTSLGIRSGLLASVFPGSPIMIIIITTTTPPPPPPKF